ncbi:MAG TPA: 3-methyl-2-oxobutanoate hydroxymethyltransferase [Acidobacteriaceae bacterium]|nr:3-methyl-2-oxobutanoate hydroxymethyltransferase [Acidobacteriaceae bacterium]
MSLTEPRSANPGAASSSLKITIPILQEKKRNRVPIAALTAYDYAMARLVDESSIDLVLVGDSLAMVMLGYESTLPVTMNEMVLFTRAVRRGVRRALLAADMPYASYHVDTAEGVRNALRFVQEAGAEAVKVEGGRNRVELVQRMTDAEIPVIGHIGLTPQSLHRMGGYRVQGKSLQAAEMLLADARALESAGAVLLVLEGVPREVAAQITEELAIPTIGIGAGPECDGQILVLHDLLNLTFAPPAKFVRRYTDAASMVRSAVESYRKDVATRSFPADNESYHLPQETRDSFARTARQPRKA